MSNYTSENLVPSIPIPGTPAVRIGSDVFVLAGGISSGGSGSGVDPSSATATPDKVLSPYTYIGSGGSVLSGTMPTVSATSSGGSVTIPAGYLESAVVVETAGSSGGSSGGSGGSSSGSSGGYYQCIETQDLLSYDMVGTSSFASFTGRYVDVLSSGAHVLVQTSGGSQVTSGAKLVYTSGGDPGWYLIDGGGNQVSFPGPYPSAGWSATGWDPDTQGWTDGRLSCTAQVPVNSGWWRGYSLVTSGGYMMVDSSGSASMHSFTHIVPESGTVYSPDALVIVKDWWNPEYGLLVKALDTGIADEQGSYYMSEEWDTEADANGFFWGGSEYSMLEYMTPGGGEEWWGEGGSGDPWNATIRKATIQFDFRYSSAPDEGSSATVYSHTAGEYEGMSITMNDAGGLSINSVNLSNWTWVDSTALSADTTYSFAIIFDLDKYYLIINNTLRAWRNAMGSNYNTSISSITFRGYEESGTLGYKNLRVWNRARRDLIPAQS